MVSTQYRHTVKLNFTEKQYEWLKQHQLMLQKNGEFYGLNHIVMKALLQYISREKTKEGIKAQ